MVLKLWMQSLHLLLFKNLKLFMMVTLKGILDIFKHKKVLLFLFGIFLLSYYNTGSSLFSVSVIIALCLHYLFLLARPSISLKNIDYVFSNDFRPSVLILLASSALFVLAGFYRPSIALNSLNYMFGPLSPFTAFAVLFSLDAKKSLKNIFLSLYKSTKLVFYNAPFVILLYGVWIFLYIPLLELVVGYIITTLKGDVLSLSFDGIRNSLPWYLCSWAIVLLLSAVQVVLLTNYYIKRVHDNFSLYE